MKAILCPGEYSIFSRRFFGRNVQWSILLSEHLPCLYGIAQVGVANVAGLPYLQTSEAKSLPMFSSSSPPLARTCTVPLKVSWFFVFLVFPEVFAVKQPHSAISCRDTANAASGCQRPQWPRFLVCPREAIERVISPTARRGDSSNARPAGVLSVVVG